ncbi:dihydropteridine reductase-like protein [Syncephalis plumigaleata]|nr:dihydropteridine reductase-like protein [Syncephalis plumigaleata]
MTSTALVYGGAGALGASTVQYFKEQGWTVFSVDVRPSADASFNVIVDPNQSVVEQAQQVAKTLQETLAGSQLDAILCVAGGWAGGSVVSLDSLANAELMWKQSVNTTLVAGYIAGQYLKPNGLLVLTGSLAAREGTSTMVGYGAAKAAVHQLTASYAGNASGLPSGTRVVAILPETLDTPGNRAGMPNADFTSWTPLNDINAKLFAWATNKDTVVNGSLIPVITRNGVTRFD